jgi:hypothetical protein
VGRLDASYSESETETFQQAIAAAEAQLGATVETVRVSDAKQEDAYFGWYANVGLGVSLHDFVYLGAQAGFDTLWIDLGDFGRDDNALGTVSALGTVTVMY